MTLLALPSALVVALPLFLAGGALASEAGGPTRRVVPVDGNPFRGSLVEADGKGNLTFADGQRRRSIAVADLARWGAPRELPEGPFVQLDCGTRFPAVCRHLSGDSVEVDSELFGAVKLPRAAVRSLVWRYRRESGESATPPPPAGGEDRLLLANGDELLGKLESLADGAVRIQVGAGRASVPIENVAVLALGGSSRPKEDAGGRLTLVVGLSDGSRIVGRKLTIQESRVAITLGGAEPLALAAPVEEVEFLQPSGGRARWLSDWTPQAYRHLPYLGVPWPYRADRNVLGQPLRAGGDLFLKGIGMHSASRLTFALDKPYRRFQASLAVDDAAAGGGSVLFRAFVDDGAGGWTERFASPFVRGGNPPIDATVDVSGARRLALIVEFADRGDERDYADWLDARLVE